MLINQYVLFRLNETIPNIIVYITLLLKLNKFKLIIATETNGTATLKFSNYPEPPVSNSIAVSDK